MTESSYFQKEKKRIECSTYDSRPLSSIFNRIGIALLVEEGVTVLFDRALSVLELVSELKREEVSFLVIIASGRDHTAWREGESEKERGPVCSVSECERSQAAASTGWPRESL